MNKKYGGKESVSFFNMSVWGKTAEALSQYLTKGKMVSVVCEAEQNRWENERWPTVEGGIPCELHTVPFQRRFKI